MYGSVKEDNMSFFEKFGRSAFELKSLKCLTVTGVLIALDVILKGLSIKITADLKITFAYIALATIGMLFGPTVAFMSGVITDIIGYALSGDGGFSPLFTLIEGVGAMIYGIFLYEIKFVKGTGYSKHEERPIIKELLISGGVGILVGAVLGVIFFLVSKYFSDAAAAGEKIALIFTDTTFIWVMAFLGFLYGAIFTFVIQMGKADKHGVGNSLKVIFSKITVVIICNLIMTPIAMVLSGYMSWDSMQAGYAVRVVKNAIQCPVDCIILLTVLFPILAAYNRIFKNKAGTSDTGVKSVGASDK